MRVRRMFRLWVIGVTAVAATGAGCITVRPVLVDRKTALENDILGGFERLNRDLPLLQASDPPQQLDPARRQVLQALLDQQLAAPEIAHLKEQQAVGEGRDGLLALRTQPVEPETRRAVERENRRRATICRGLVATTPELKDGDLPAVRRFFQRKYASECQPGDPIQDDSGEWKGCPTQD